MKDFFNGHKLEQIGRGNISKIHKLNSNNGKKYIFFSVAHNSYNHVEYVNYVAYGSNAESIDKYATIGTYLEIDSTPRTRQYEDEKTKKIKAEKQYIVDRIMFLGNTKFANTKDNHSWNKHEIDKIKESMEDVNHIAIAKKILIEEGYQITKEGGDE